MGGVKTDIKRAMRKIKDLEDVQRKTAAAVLRDVSKYVKKQSAKSIVNTHYSNVPEAITRNKIYTRVFFSARAPLEKYNARVRIGGGDIPAMYMDLESVQVNTPRGKRWAVRLRKGKEPGMRYAFHLISIGQKLLIQGQGAPFTKHSKLFVRNSDDSLKQYKFKSFSDVLRDTGEVNAVYKKGYDRMALRGPKLLKRYMDFWDKQKAGIV